MINCRNTDGFSLNRGLLANKGIWLVTGVLFLLQGGDYLPAVYADAVRHRSAAAALLVRDAGGGGRDVLRRRNREATDPQVP